MPKTVTIVLTGALTDPLIGHEGPIGEIVIREPTYDEYVTCGGEPYSVGRSPEGTFFSVEKPEVIWAYAEACIVKPLDQSHLLRANWRVAREVRKAIIGFFRAADEDSEPSPTSPTTSSSNSTSPSTLSAV